VRESRPAAAPPHSRRPGALHDHVLGPGALGATGRTSYDGRPIETPSDRPPARAPTVERDPDGAVAFRAALVGAVDEIDRQLSFVRRLLHDALDGHHAPERRPPPDVVLTPRQLEILRLVAQGRSTASIAAELWLSVATVRNHVARTMRALGAHSRIEAVARAREAGLL
jgi:DNA-binding NarL/FixJ family response regulator